MIGDYAEFGTAWAYIFADGDTQLGITEDGRIFMRFTCINCRVYYLGCLDLENVEMPPEDTDDLDDLFWEEWALDICYALDAQDDWNVTRRRILLWSRPWDTST